MRPRVLETPAMTRAAGASTVLLTAAAMIAFAANSLLCRMALGAHLIDAASFTAVRLVCGALFLALLVVIRHRSVFSSRADAIAVGALFGYAIAFSFAYLGLSAGTGALILFGAVQITMIGAGLINRERLSPLGWGGLVLGVHGIGRVACAGRHSAAHLQRTADGHRGHRVGHLLVTWSQGTRSVTRDRDEFPVERPACIAVGTDVRPSPSGVGRGTGSRRRFGCDRFWSWLRDLVCSAGATSCHRCCFGAVVSAGHRGTRRRAVSR